jgi:hypothetical protein
MAIIHFAFPWYFLEVAYNYRSCVAAANAFAFAVSLIYFIKGKLFLPDN